MKNRRIAICAFVLIAAMVVGIGYASLTDTLAVTGDLEMSQSSIQVALDEDVYFTGVEISIADSNGTALTPTTGLSASVSSNDPDKITFSAKNVFTGIGDTVTIVATITNAGTNAALPAKLSDPKVTAENGQNYFEGVSKTYSASSDTGADVQQSGLPVGETCTLTIVFKVKAIPTVDVEHVTVTYSVTATAGG